MTYAEKLKDPRWQKRRLEVMQRDGFKCRDCSATDKTLHVHHCFYAKGDPWDTEDALMITVCHECHKRRETIECKARERLAVYFLIYSPDQMSDFIASGFRINIGGPKV